MKRINFAIIGQGYIGKRHADMVRQNPAARLVAVCDILPKKMTDTESISEPYYQDIDEMITSHPEIEVVSVCTPNGLHAQHALKALRANKNVVCEKPMALSISDCQKIIALADQMQKHVFCVMQNRFSPPSAWIKDVIDKRVLGDIHIVQLNCYWNRDGRYYKTGGWKGSGQLDGGTLFTQFSHFIDIMYWLFGDIKDIHAQFADFEHAKQTDFEDSGIIDFKFISGGMGSINYSTAIWDKNLESSLTIIGSKGSIKIGGQYMDKVEHCHVKDYELPLLAATRPANNYGAYMGSANNHDFVIQNVVETLNGKAPVATDAQDGLAVVSIIERIYSLRETDKYVR
ncbi:MAG TPA: Gfo/Idh/MocA family oxidoreductase [Patescibacteria group bacterium]|jgi:UDP-N-acetyl-2-amino-2-deoxyglucuronate dehydrogenase|nr:Gfo/Idh/MocA family oxidoreductase [Patescibacteria group bacterium]